MARVVAALPPGGPAAADVVVEGATTRLAREGEAAHGRLLIGAAATGAVVLVRLTTDSAPLEVGRPATPLAAALLDLADDLWGTGTSGLTSPGWPPGAQGGALRS